MSAEQSDLRALPEAYISIHQAVQERENVPGNISKFHNFSEKRGVYIWVYSDSDPETTRQQGLEFLNHNRRSWGLGPISPEEYPYISQEPYVYIEYAGALEGSPADVLFQARITKSNNVNLINSKTIKNQPINLSPIQMIEIIREGMGIGSSRN